MNWMPIETAPKDGTVICGVRFERIGDYVFPFGGTMQWEGGEGRVLSGFWAWSGFVVCQVKEGDLPTHWLPLPEPPKGEG